MNSAFLWLPFYIPEPRVCLPEGWMWLKQANDQEEPVTTFFKSVTLTYLKNSAVLISLSWSLTCKLEQVERGNGSLPFDLQIIGLHKNSEREGKVRDPAGLLGDFLLGGVSNPRCSNETSSAQTKGGKKRQTNSHQSSWRNSERRARVSERADPNTLTRWGVVVCLFVIWVNWSLNFLSIPQ